jgi:beta-glucosidase
MRTFKTISFILITGLAAFVWMGFEISEQPSVSDNIDQRVEAILAKMTLEEKAGQMTNISLMALAKGEFWMRRDTIELDTAKIRDLILNRHVGSVQNLGTYPLSPFEWRKYIGLLQDIAINQTRLGIPILYGIDAVHGANYTAGSTLLPQQLALAASWNPTIVEKAGAITSYEVRASGIPWNYAPVLDVCRNPLWGRIFETFGEDTYLTTVMGQAMIRGAQGENIAGDYATAVCLKHFWGYGHPANGKDRSPTYLPERMLRQTHLPPFAAAIEQGALTVMLNSGSVNGIPSHADHYLITEILKGELGFEGFVISDWEDVMNLVNTHQVAKDEKEAVRIAVNAGLDMCMEPYDASFAEMLVELVNEGEVPMARVDDAVRRILRVKMKLGLFERPLTNPNIYDKFGSDEFANTSYETALEAMTLLKNENNVLPLPKGKKVLVTGVASNSLNYLNGAWSRTWGGDDTTFNDAGKQTIVDAIRAKVGAANVAWIQGTGYDADINTEAAVRAAANVDYIIVCLGEKPATEKPSDIDNLEMPRVQLDLVKAMAKTGKLVILVLVEARPRVINEIEPLTAGILMAYLPGNEGGRAIAEVLYGDYNPSGKLPVTYPRYAGSIWPYDHTKSDRRDAGFGHEGFKPQFEFGFGLSYTDFIYSDLTLSRDTMFGQEPLEVSITVTNSGSRKGKEVVQLYTADLVASIVPAVKQLRRFEKVELAAGESRTIRFSLAESDLAFVDMKNTWITEEGEFTLTIDTLTKNIHYQKGSPAPLGMNQSIEINNNRKRNKQ